MDIGQLKNPFSSKDPKKATSSGMFKIGDYDEQPQQNNTDNCESNSKSHSKPQANRESTATSLKEGVQSTLDKLSGQSD
ncbi:hypothetical protein CLU79DRAFT_727931 [Phycomyces nitens]|nr:hypothetical protein CLU79DRAFT_727931 [Phycomyces nitens]